MGIEKEYIIKNSEDLNLTDFSVKYNELKDFTTLDAWKKACFVKYFFYKKIVPFLPSDEKFNLNIQIRKASISATANISEGYGRYHYQEGIQFYRISRGSIYELKDHLITCFELNFIEKEILDEGLFLIEDSKKTLNGFIKFVQSQKTKTE